MKKLLFLLALVSASFTGCVKGDDTYERLKPVIPGMQIYSGAKEQNIIALQQGNMALRLAMLMAEAEKQDKENLEDVKGEGSSTSLRQKLFGMGSKVEAQANGVYKITFVPEYWGEIDRYAREGSFFVDTKGKQLSQANSSTPWTVTIKNDFIFHFYTETGSAKLVLSRGMTTLFAEYDGSISILPTNIVANFDRATIYSDWTGNFSFIAPNAGLAYSDCKGKRFKFSGSAAGATFNTYDGTASSDMSYDIRRGEYIGSQIILGIETCQVLSNYSYTSYPSREVQYEWFFVEDSRKLWCEITYNGNVVKP